MPECLDTTVKVVQIGFYIVTPAIAAFGLKSWRSQLQGKAEYDVAKNVVAGAYRVRDAIKAVQSPFMTSHEWVGRDAVPGETPKQKAASDTFYAYAKRFDRVRQALSDWYPAIVESEALFGAAARLDTRKLEVVANKLWVAIEMYYRNEYEDREPPLTALYNIIYGVDPRVMTDLPEKARNDQGFHAEFDTAMQALERTFVPHLRKGRA